MGQQNKFAYALQAVKTVTEYKKKEEEELPIINSSIVIFVFKKARVKIRFLFNDLSNTITLTDIFSKKKIKGEKYCSYALQEWLQFYLPGLIEGLKTVNVQNVQESESFWIKNGFSKLSGNDFVYKMNEKK